MTMSETDLKIISFSLYGDNPKYTEGAIRNAEIANEYWPGWECHFYIGEDVPQDVASRLTDLGSKCIVRSDRMNGMFWRFEAADSTNVMISRDTDSRIGLREYYAVNEWLESDKNFHIMRDHQYHGTEILGGMWGSRNGLLLGLVEKIREYKDIYNHAHQIDQNFLREVVYPHVKDDSMVHDEFFAKAPFPKDSPPRTNTYFVGQAYDQNDNPEYS